MSAALEQEVQSAVESLFAAFRSRDLDAIMAHYAPADDIICLGPAADDVSVGVHGVYNTVSRQVSQAHELQCQYVHASCGFKGDVSWTIGQASMVFVLSSGTHSFQGRYTSVLEYNREMNRWLIRHSLFSVPTANQSIAALFPSDMSNPTAPPPMPAMPGDASTEAATLDRAEAASVGAAHLTPPPPPPPPPAG